MIRHHDGIPDTFPHGTLQERHGQSDDHRQLRVFGRVGHVRGDRQHSPSQAPTNQGLGARQGGGQQALQLQNFGEEHG